MPLPKTKDVGKIMHVLKRDKPDMKHEQMIAIALEVARKRKKK